MAASSDTDTGRSSLLVITCKGNITDHDLTKKLQRIKLHLSELSESGDELLSIAKIEPWNSVRVTFNIPPEAAQRLQQLAQTDSQVLQNLGILSVQIENNDLVTIPPPPASTPVSQHVQPPFSVGVGHGHSVMSSVVPTSSPMRMTVANQQASVMNPLNFGAMRPNLPWGQVQVPRMQGNMPAGMQGNVQVGIPPTLQGSIPSGMQPGIQAGIQLNMQGSMQPGMQQNMHGGMQPGMHADMQTGIQGSIQPGMTPPNMQGNMQTGILPSMQTSMQSGRQPVMQGNIQPGMQQSMNTNMQPGMQPVMQGGIQPGMQGGMQPGIQGGIQPGMQGGLQPGMQGGMQPGMPPGMQGSMQPGMQPGMQGGMRPGMQGGMQPGMQPNIPQGMQQGMNPNVPPFNQIPQFFYQGEMPMQRFGLNMSPPADAKPKKKRRSRPKPKKKNADKEKDATKSPDSQPKDGDSPQTASDMKAIATPPPSLANNQMSPAGNTNQPITNQNQQVPTSLPFAEPTQPGSTTSTPPIKKPDVSITSPLLVNLLQREIPGTQFPFSNRGIVPSSLASTIQQGGLNPKKPMNNLPQSTLSQGLPPMPPASEITRMLPESIGLPPLPANQSVTDMSSPQTSSLMSAPIRSQTPNRQQINTMNQPVSTQHFQPPSDTSQMNQPTSDATHNLFGASQNLHSSAGLTNVLAQQNMATLTNSSMTNFTTATGMPMQEPSSVLQPGLGGPFGQIEQARQTPTPLSNNMSPPVRLSGMQSPGPNNLPFATPGMINPRMAHGMPTHLQQAQALSSAAPTSVYQQGMNQMINQGQRQFPVVTSSQIRNQLPFPLHVHQQQQSQIHHINLYFPSNINPQANAGQTPTNQGVNFPQGANFNQGPAFHQRPPVSGNMPFNVVNIPGSIATSNLPQFRMPTSTELSHASGKGAIPGASGNVMQTGPVSMIPGTINKLPGRPRGYQQMPHSTQLPPTSITFPSIPRFPVKPPSKMVMPFDETTLDGISDAEKDLLAMAEKVANEAGMETSNRMANLFSKDSSRDSKQSLHKDLLTSKDTGQVKVTDSRKTSAGEAIKDIKSDDVKQKKPPVIQLTKQPHDIFTTGDTQNIASWSSTILPIHGKEGYSLHTHTSSSSSDKKAAEQVDGNNRFKPQGFAEVGTGNNSLNSQSIKSNFCLPGDGTSKPSSSQNTVQGVGVSVPFTETGAQYVSMPRGEVPYHSINFLSQFNTGAIPDKKFDNPPLAADELNRNKHQSFYRTNINASPQNLNQGHVSEQKVSDKSSILMQMMNMEQTCDNSGMISLTRTLSEPVGTHGGQTTMAPETVHTDSIKMPTLERMPRDSESIPPRDQQENGTDVAELNAESIAKPTVPGFSQPLMPQLIPKQPSQQQTVNIYSPKSLLLPSCMPPPTHGSTGNLVNPESQKSVSSSKFDKRSRSVSPVTLQGNEFPRLPLAGGSFIKQTPSPTTSSPSGMGMSASALLSSIAKSAYNAGITPRMQSPSESRPATSQPLGLPPNTSASSPTGLPLYANPLGPDAHTKPITVKVSPVPAPEVIKSTPLLPSVLPIVSQSSKMSSEPTEIKGQSNLTSSIKAVEMKQAHVTQPTHLEAPSKSSVPQQEKTPDQPLPSSHTQINVPIQPVMNIKKGEFAPSVGQLTHDISTGPSQGASVGDQKKVDAKTSISKTELPKDSSSTQLKRKHESDSLSDLAPKVLKLEGEVKTNINQVKIEQYDPKTDGDGDGELSGEHRPLPLLVRESNIEVGKTGKDKSSVDQSLDATTEDNSVVVSKEVLTMPTLLPSKVELTDIAKCKDSHQYDTTISFSLKSTAKTGENSSIDEDTKMSSPPKDLPVQGDNMKATATKEATEAKLEGTAPQMASKQEIPSATPSKSPTEISPASSKDSTKSSPVERRITPKRRAAEEASRPVSERTAPSRQCTQQVDEPPATRARRTTRNKSPTDHPTRLREREREDSIGSCRDQHTDPGTDNDARMTRKRSTRIFSKGTKDHKEK